jgi:hypothetical protein
MTDRLSKADRKKLRASLKNKGMFEEGLYAGHCDDLLDDLDAADAEIKEWRDGCKERDDEYRALRAEKDKQLEQSAAREAVLRTEVTRMNHSYVQMGCMKKPEYCAPCRVLANTSEAARELLEIKRKWDEMDEEYRKSPTDFFEQWRLRENAETERDTLKRQRDVAIAALKQYADEDNCWDWHACDPAVFTVDKTAPWKLAQEALRAVEQDDA